MPYEGDVFWRFGEEAYPFLAPLLDHEHRFVQVGAYAAMNSAMNRHGLKRHTKDTREERVTTMRAFQAILADDNASKSQSASPTGPGQR